MWWIEPYRESVRANVRAMRSQGLLDRRLWIRLSIVIVAVLVVFVLAVSIAFPGTAVIGQAHLVVVFVVAMSLALFVVCVAMPRVVYFGADGIWVLSSNAVPDSLRSIRCATRGEYLFVHVTYQSHQPHNQIRKMEFAVAKYVDQARFSPILMHLQSLARERCGACGYLVGESERCSECGVQRPGPRNSAIAGPPT